MRWQSYSRVWTIRWWPVVGGASRHSCSKDRSEISPKGYRDDRRLKSEVGYEGVKEKGSVLTGFKFVMWYLLMYCLILFK